MASARDTAEQGQEEEAAVDTWSSGEEMVGPGQTKAGLPQASTGPRWTPPSRPRGGDKRSLWVNNPVK